ncbi:MAG: UDP-N-acetylmuramoyl-L-alanine--D-glutamate ligase [Clostridia bacterium]|nr:UDP-N-acetylmuramoyl-L-alanine--D-glutamate ligase [Clostridia bacterium]
MYYKNQTFLVVGLQKSGYSASKLLIEKGATVYVYDSRKTESVENNKQELISLGAKDVINLDGIEDICNVLVLSPGVPIDSELVVRFKKCKKRVLGELELGTMQFTTPIIAVTGTNGKTTVSTVLHKALNEAGIKTELAGNVGVSVTSKIEDIKNADAVVLEVSSYQLESTYAFIPHVSVVLNLTPDHLDRHYTFENYALVKSKIVIPQKESEFAVLNYDDETVKTFAELSPANKVWFSCREKVDGTYIENGYVYFKEEKLFELNSGSLKNVYCVQNLLAIVAVLKIMGVENEKILSSLDGFTGVSHRREEVCVKNGITFINDSKSTNPASAISAINSLEYPTVLILGGYDKGLDYTELFVAIKSSDKIKSVVVTGKSAFNMLSCAEKENVNVTYASDFTGAVTLAYKLATSGDCVLLSPATSSFDEFDDFEKRGERFSEIAKSI